MRNKNLITIIGVAWLALLLTGCSGSLPSVSLDLFGTVPPDQKPHSNFVDARVVRQVRVGQQVEIESYHLSRGSRLGEVQIWVNDQLIRSEQTAAPSNFPDYLGDVQVLGWIDQRDATKFLIFPSATCDYAAQVGVSRSKNPIELDYPSSSWSLCHIWIGFVPGNFVLSLEATDSAGNIGQRITQHIEVLE